MDSDFDSTRRQEVIDYVVYKYGRENISQIITFGTLAARAVIRRAGKAMDYPYATCDKIAKMIPAEVGITIKKALEANENLRALYREHEDIQRLLDFSMKLEGLPTNTSTHAAGVLITDKAGVDAYVPMWKNDSGIVCQYSKDLLEGIGLLKMDFLGLNTLGILGDAKKLVKELKGIDIDFDELYKIPTLEPLSLISEGKTECLFQLSGPGMTGFMKELKPSSIEDIIAGISMYRPGPMDEIPKFLYQKRNPDRIRYSIEGLSKILDTTYGTIVYQEQCMNIVTEIAGFGKGDSDNFRRIISKKKLKEMPKQREWFIYGRKKEDYDHEGKLRKYKNEIPGGLALGHSEIALNELFDAMVAFAAYAFNKSHAAAYAYVAYLTAWFMYYYPEEFMASNMTHSQGSKAKIAKYVSYCRKILGIDVLPPHINLSTSKFAPTGENKIVFSLATKNTKGVTIEAIIKERNLRGPYESLTDFLDRTADFLDKQTYESLVSSGAFDCFGVVKSQYLAALDEFWEKTFKKAKNDYAKLLTKGEEVDLGELLQPRINELLPNINEFPSEIALRLEKEMLGMYLTGNPLYKYAYTIKTKSNFAVSDIDYEVSEDTGEILLSNPNIRDRQPVTFVGIINSIQEITTKAKKLMARIEVEDLTGVGGCLVWADNYKVLSQKIVEGEMYLIEGSLMVKDEEPPTIVINDANSMDEIATDRLIIYAQNPQEGFEIVNFIKDNPIAQGSVPTYLVNKNQRVLLTREYWANASVILNKYKSKIMTW